MTDNINEKISALLDNELDLPRVHDTLDMLVGDATLRKKWDHYHLIGDAMRGEAVRVSAESIADRVRARLEAGADGFTGERPPTNLRTARFQSRWARSAGGAALAASVAVITVLAFPELTQNSPESGVQIVAEQSPRSDVPVVAEQSPPNPAPYLIQSSTRWKNLSEPRVESKLNRYLIDHNEFTSPGGIGLIPYTNFVSYDSNR